MNAAVEVENLSHTYAAGDGPVALDNVSLTIGAGEIFGILGPNGGGKTTLFRILTTMLRPSSAASKVRIFNASVLNEPAVVRGHLGVVFQNPSLDVKLTAQENLTHHGRLYGLGGVLLQQRIDTWMQRIGLSDRRHERVERFSGGMRRRVELAKAMLHEPRLLLMDEPATGLDPGARRELWHHLEQLRAQQHVTIVLTTHLMEEADRCDRVAILAAGRVVALDTPANLKAAIRGDVIVVEPAADSPGLCQRIHDQLAPWADGRAPSIVDGKIHFEKPDGPKLIAQLTAALPGQISSITMGQPTLEDVFVHLTGGTLWNQTVDTRG